MLQFCDKFKPFPHKNTYLPDSRLAEESLVTRLQSLHLFEKQKKNLHHLPLSAAWKRDDPFQQKYCFSASFQSLPFGEASFLIPLYRAG